MRQRSEKEILDEARARAHRARKYAKKFPDTVRPIDTESYWDIYGETDWQLEQVRRFGTIDPELQRD